MSVTSFTIRGARNWEIYGGEIVSSEEGLRVEGDAVAGECRNITWWGFVVHNTGDESIVVGSDSGPVTGIDLRGEVTAWGEAREANGLSLGEGSSPASPLADSTFVVYAHDASRGSAVQVGPHAHNCEVTVQADRILKIAPDGSGGNALQLVGTDLRTVTVPYVGADTVNGRVVETVAVGAGNPAGAVTVEKGRGVNVRLRPGYAPHPAVVYQDCIIGPGGRGVSDTIVTASDSVRARVIRGMVDTIATVTDTLSRTRVGRGLADTAVTASDTATRAATHSLSCSDTIVTHSDTVASVRTLALADTLVTFSEAVV